MAHRPDGLAVDPRSGFCPSNSIFYSKRKPIPFPSDPDLDVTKFLSSRRHSGTTALIDAASGRRVSFPALWRSVDALASALSSRFSVRKGHVVLLLSPNSIHFPVVSLAVMSLGAVLTTTNPVNTPQEIAKQISDSDPILAFAIRPLVGKLPRDRDFPIVLLEDCLIASDDANSNLSLSNEGGEKPTTKKPAPKRFVKSQISPEIRVRSCRTQPSTPPPPYSPPITTSRSTKPFTASSPLSPAVSLFSSLTASSCTRGADGLLMYAPPPKTALSSPTPPTVPAASTTSLQPLSRPTSLSTTATPALFPFRLPASPLSTSLTSASMSLLAAIVRSTFAPSSKLLLAGTIQFVAAVHAAKSILSSEGYDITVPQANPLSAGEVLECTAPTIPRGWKLSSSFAILALC